MSRFSLKIAGASGQGVISTGEILAKAIKRRGHCVYGYREYASLIKGGHHTYQLDVGSQEVRSPERLNNVVIAMNHHGLELNLTDLKPGGVLIHDTAVWNFPPEHQARIERDKLRIIYLPVEEILVGLNAKPILANVLLSAFVWASFGGEKELLRELVGERFKHKKDVLELNMRCIDEGYRLAEEKSVAGVQPLPEPNAAFKDHLLLIGAQSTSLGIVHAGCRMYAGYPMTPASPILSFIAEIQNETGMVIKQAEDEITAAQMVSGAMHMGCRAITATSGGGFDLMTETLSMNGILENPTVFILAQRPGPGTGLPTWSAQGDLLLACFGGHGEFARCILSVSDGQDSFDLMPIAFNIAEKYQISVIVLTEKNITEAIYTQSPWDMTKATLERGNLVTDPAKLAALKATDRYDPAATDGISPRWLPGSEAATWNAQGDEHSGDGSIDESAENAVAQMDKRMKKLAALERELPDPELFVCGEYGLRHAAFGGSEEEELDLLLVGWGSTKGAVLDVLESDEMQGKRVGYLHYTYLWPLKTDRLLQLTKRAKKTVLIEGNVQGQLGVLVAQKSGYLFTDKILQYDGRPFWHDDLKDAVLARCGAKKAKASAKRSTKSS